MRQSKALKPVVPMRAMIWGRTLGWWTGRVLSAVLLVVLTIHAAGVLQDLGTSISYPFAWDPAEGIVWEQAALIPGPRMYSASQALPFIAFHYPPVFHLLARAALLIAPDLLSAGRLVAALATIFMAIFVGLLVWIAARPTNGSPSKGWRVVAIAIAIGLLVPCVHAMHYWSPTMRVDTAAIALSLMALLVAVWANGRFWPTTAALLLCVVSVYTKQTEISAGVAIFLVGLSRNARGTLLASLLAAIAAVAALAWLQWITNGGFLFNVIGYNINPLSRWAGYVVLRNETRESLPFVALMLVGFASCAIGIYRQSPISAWYPARNRAGSSTVIESATIARAHVIIYFAVSGLITSVTIFKYGSNVNYLIDFFSAGCILIGILLCDYRDVDWACPSLVAILLAGVLYLPVRALPNRPDITELRALVDRISAAKSPVASEDMVLNLRAGKPIMFEADMVTLLTSLRRYDETPLVNMISTQGFAFMITYDNVSGGNAWRSPAVDAAMREVYPRTEQIGGYWVHLPEK